MLPLILGVLLVSGVWSTMPTTTCKHLGCADLSAFQMDENPAHVRRWHRDSY